MLVQNDCIEVYYEDLTKEAKATFLEIQMVESPKDGNWDIFPIATIPLQE